MSTLDHILGPKEGPSLNRLHTLRYRPEQKFELWNDKNPEIGGGDTVLVVDDDLVFLEIVSFMLTRLGFTVLQARDGVDAVEVFKQHQESIRCVLCDLIMPRLNGWETLDALRRLAPGIPVILSSGCAQAEVFVGDHPELPQIFLGKPYRLKELQEATFKALEKKPNGTIQVKIVKGER
jgi:CheY-like chemotaxis protein